MIRLGAIVSAVIALMVLWSECGEDIGIFCYRIGWGAFATLRSRALAPVASTTFTRTRAACLRPSDISSTCYTAQRDFER